MSAQTVDRVLLAVKTPLMPQATSGFVDPKLTVGESIAALCSCPPKDANGSRVLQQLTRETSGAHSLLSITPSGKVVKVDPKTPLREIAVRREIRTERGIEEVPGAAVEVQKYTPVGKGGRV